MALNIKPRFPGYLPVKVSVHRLVQIEHPSTPQAAKVVVIVRPGVEAAKCATHIKLQHLTTLA
jgi:hypothetical protein